MIAQFTQDLYNKNFSLQDQGKDDPIDTLDKRIKLWLTFIRSEGLVAHNLYDYDFIDESLDNSVRGSDRRELKKLLDILRCKRVRNQLKCL